jgi:hypothetical protein
MFQDDDVDTEMLAKHVKHVLLCSLEPNVDEGITAHEAMGISVNKKSVAEVELSLGNGKC